jgi:hypothetical protein
LLNQYFMENQEHRKELCEQAAKEQDPEKLMQLTKEIIRLLAKRTLAATRYLRQQRCWVPFSSWKSFGIRSEGIAIEPSGPSKWTVAGEIRKGRQITTLNVRSVLHPGWIVFIALTNRPVACEMPCLNLP